MYWVVLGIFTAVESLPPINIIIFIFPGYAWLRLLARLYLVMPGKQGATFLYQEYVHPFLEQHESELDTFISEAHDRAKKAGLQYLKQAIEFVKVNVLGMQPRPPTPPPSRGQSYAESLLSRFNLPSAREGLAAPAGDFYGLLASALQSTTSTGASREAQAEDLSASGTLIPPNIDSNEERMSYVSAQRERLRVLLQAFDRAAYDLSSPPSTSSLRENRSDEHLAKSRSELDFDKIERDEAGTPRPAAELAAQASSWIPWNWSGKSPVVDDEDKKDQ